MYAPNSVPEGPHHIYIFQDQTRPWFKIGESRSPDDRIKTLLGSILALRLSKLSSAV